MLDVLYLSTVCSTAEYERMFHKFGTTLSHAGQKFGQLMLQGFAANGWSVYALSQRIVENGADDELCRPDETENGIKYMYLPCWQNRTINRVLTIWKAMRGIGKWHREHPDGFIICDILAGELSLALCLVSKVLKIKTCALVTDVPTIRAGETRTGLKALPYKLKAALISSYDSYIFLTEQMNVVLNSKAKPYTIVEGIVDESVVKKPNSMEEKHPEKVFVMAGLLEDIYGVNDLLDGFEKLDCPEARLRFYGKGGSVEKIAAASERDSRITYCGELTNAEMVQEEKKATLLINPRPPIGTWTAYSFPSKNMEYMASGTPMLAYVLPCMPEEYLSYFFHIEDGTGDVPFHDMLKKIASMDREKLHEFGLSAQKWIVEEKNAKNQMEKVIRMAEVL